MPPPNVVPEPASQPPAAPPPSKASPESSAATPERPAAACAVADFACLDLERLRRTGMAETVYCAGKTPEQAAAIFAAFAAAGQAVLGTRASEAVAQAVCRALPQAHYEPVARTLTLPGAKRTVRGRVAICSGGTADLPVAEEAAQTAGFFGAQVERFYDVGVAGLHRLLGQLEAIRRADAVIAVAGMEGALASVVAGLVEVPVVAVPPSAGYGAAPGGLSSLRAMVNSCAEGVSVVNIDNGFGAAVQVCRMLNRRERTKEDGNMALP